MENSLIESLRTSAINSSYESKIEFQQKLLSNKQEKMITILRKELEKCDEFIISVAFITESGLTLILEQLRELEIKGVKGKIMTGDYLNFTQPKALKRLLKFKNIELKLLSNEKFHAKGYFFKRDKMWSIYIGSSNLTQTALTTNFEWNLKVNSLEDGKIAKNVIGEFDSIFNSIKNIDLIILEQYEEIYKLNRDFIKKQKTQLQINEVIVPNQMQKNALEKLEKLRKNEDRGLLISATGTGKTYISAFDVKNANPKKILFIAHRKLILQKAIESYQKIIPEKEMALYEKNPDADYVFAMVQTLSKDENLKQYAKDRFDYIVVDEVHHSGAKSYQNIIDYFKPKFLLGMTATPERTDNFNIYDIFNHNIAYEIRLYDALAENLLTPFHYFGISDIEIDGEVINEKTSINNLSADVRVDYIIEKSKFYGYSGDKLHGLIFVSRKDEAKNIAQKLSERGINSKALVGEHSDKEREHVVRQLQNGEISYIVTVDIFNEGIDIPCVNQIILLRPTQSSIVYIQQLGRGLRKYKDKDYVVVLDFIGNYEKNFLIPVAVSQDNTYDKDYLKRFIIHGTEIIPGESTITFERIAKERIFENINRSVFSNRKNIEKDFKILEMQLGRVPMLYDFFEKNMIDPSVILKYKKTYDEILNTLKPSHNLGTLSSIEQNYLKFLSSFFTPAKRIHEMEIINYLIRNKFVDLEQITEYIEDKYKLKDQTLNTKNALDHLVKQIFTSLSTIKEFLPIIENNIGIYKLSTMFKDSYEKNKYFKLLIDDLINYNLSYCLKHYFNSDEICIVKYREYTKQEAFWCLNLDYNNGYQVSGYTVFEEERKVVLFVTLKDGAYDNKFFDNKTFTWYSKNNRCLKRSGKLTIEGKIAENFYKLEVFVKKELSENFYYLGQVKEVVEFKETLSNKGNKLVEYKLKLENEIEDSLYEYLIG